jgi:hypothetical protein
MGAGPLPWLLAVEIIPCRAIEIGLALSSAVWWAFNLVFAMTLASLLEVIGVSGLCAIHAIVCGLMYCFVLHLVPDIRDNSLQEIEHFYKSLQMMKSHFNDTSRFRSSFRSNASSSTDTNL